MRLIQIPFSHNCIKVRTALKLKQLAYETLDIAPTDRSPVIAASGQPLVPVLENDGRVISDSTNILQYLEQTFPERSLLPEGAGRQADCWILEDWADRAFMSLTRRIAYWQVLMTPGVLEQLFFPGMNRLKQFVMTRVARRVVTRRFRLSVTQNEKDEKEATRVARIALVRLDGRRGFFGDRPTIADVTLAALAAPLQSGDEQLRSEPSVAELLAWVRPIVGDDVIERYSPAGRSSGS